MSSRESGREPISESSLLDGCEEVPDELVDADGVGLCDVLGAETLRVSVRRLGVD